MLSDNMMLGGSGRKAAYPMENSLLFSGAQSLYRSFTTSATIGLSMWVRRAKFGAISPLLGSSLKFNANDTLTAWSLTTTSVYRDLTAWIHVAIATGRLYVNGEDVGAVMTSAFTCSATNCLGYDGTNYFHGEITEFVLTDGGQPVASYYGEFDPVTLNWRPKAVSLPANLPVYGANILSGGTASTLGSLTAGSAVSALGGNTDVGLNWSGSSYTGKEWRYDCGSVKYPSRIRQYTTTTATCVGAWEIHGCNNADFTTGRTLIASSATAGAFSDLTGWQDRAFTAPSTGYRYLILVPTSGTNSMNPSNQPYLYEFEVNEAIAATSAYGTNGCYLGKPWVTGAALGFDYGGTAPSANYNNFGGSGNRSGFMAVSSSGSWAAAPTMACVDGTTSGTLFRTNANAWSTYSITFDFGVPVSFDAVAMHCDSSVNYGATKWQACNDGVSFADVGSQFNLVTTANTMAEIALTGTTGTNYRYWKMVGLSATLGNASAWFYEVNFKSTAAGNHWNPVGFVSTDVLTDTPTNVFLTLSPLSGRGTLSNGNLTLTTGGTGYWKTPATRPLPTTGKWYWEWNPVAAYTSSTSYVGAGVARLSETEWDANQVHGYYATEWAWDPSGNKRNNNTQVSYGGAQTLNTVYGYAYDADTGSLYVRNASGWLASSNPVGGTSPMYAGISGEVYPYAVAAAPSTSTVEMNFGQNAFAYAPPTGFKSLCTANLPATTGQTGGTFTANGSADGPFVYTGAVPEGLSINGNAVTWGAHADKLATGFKIRSASDPFNGSGLKTWVATYNKKPTVGSNKTPATAQVN